MILIQVFIHKLTRYNTTIISFEGIRSNDTTTRLAMLTFRILCSKMQRDVGCDVNDKLIGSFYRLVLQTTITQIKNTKSNSKNCIYLSTKIYLHNTTRQDRVRRQQSKQYKINKIIMSHCHSKRGRGHCTAALLEASILTYS